MVYQSRQIQSLAEFVSVDRRRTYELRIAVLAQHIGGNRTRRHLPAVSRRETESTEANQRVSPQPACP